MKIRNLIAILALGTCAATGWVGEAAAQDKAPVPGKSVEITEKGDVITPQTAPAAAAAAVTSGTLRMLRTLETFHKDVKTIHAVFDQTRTDEAFLESIQSKGELWFDKPSRFRCDYADPKPSITLIVGDTFYNYVPEIEQVDFFKFNSPAERDQQLHQLLIGFGFKADDLIRQYEVHSSIDEPAPKAELVGDKLDPEKKVLFVIKPIGPTAETCPFMLSKVIIDKASHLPERIWYKDRNGTATFTLRMKKVDLDAKLTDTLFDKDKLFPKGTEFIDKRNAQ